MKWGLSVSIYEMGALDSCLCTSVCNAAIPLNLSLSLSLLWDVGNEGSFILCHPRVSVPLLMSHLGARHHRSRTERVRYLLESSRAINLLSPPWLPRKH